MSESASATIARDGCYLALRPSGPPKLLGLGGLRATRSRGDEGGDTIDVANGDAGDSGDCGPGTDTVEVDAIVPDGSDTPVSTDDVVNCEMINLVT